MRVPHLAQWCVAILFTAYAVLLLTQRHAPSLADYSDWTYEGVLLRNHLLGTQDTAHIFKHYPVPNSASTLGIGLLALVFPWQLAAKVWLVLSLLLAFLSTRFMLQQYKHNSYVWLFAPAGCFLGVNFWYGFINFQVGLCLTLLTSTLLVRNDRRHHLLGVLLVLTFFAHMIPLLFACLAVCFYALQHRRFRMLLQLLPSVFLSVWYVLGRVFAGHNADANVGLRPAVHNYSPVFWAYKVNSLLKSLGFVNPGTEHGSVSVHVFGSSLFLFLFGLNVLLCALVGWCLFKEGISAYRSRSNELFLWAAGSIFAGLYLIAPATMLGVSDPGSRLLQTDLAVLLLLLAKNQQHRLPAMRWIAGCAVVLQAAAFVLFTKVALSPGQEAASVSYLPRRVVTFSHIANHSEDYFLRALERGDTRLRIFPTGMFLNSISAEPPPAEQ